MAKACATRLTSPLDAMEVIDITFESGSIYYRVVAIANVDYDCASLCNISIPYQVVVIVNQCH